MNENKNYNRKIEKFPQYKKFWKKSCDSRNKTKNKVTIQWIDKKYFLPIIKSISLFLGLQHVSVCCVKYIYIYLETYMRQQTFYAQHNNSQQKKRLITISLN